MNLQISITDGSASVLLAILVVQLSIYLHISIQHNHPLSVPILMLIVTFSVLFGALQVSIINCSTCYKCLAEKDYEEAEAEYEDEEEEEEEEEEEAEEEAAEAAEAAEAEEYKESHPETVADKSLQQLREFAAKIQELNLKNVCKYEPTETILNPEEIFEPRESPKPLSAIPEARTPEFPPSQAPIPEVLESALVAGLTQSETPL